MSREASASNGRCRLAILSTIMDDRSSVEYLAIRHQPDGLQDVGALSVRAEAKGFGGTSLAYFNDSDVLRFAEQLAAYPLPPDSSFAIRLWRDSTRRGVRRARSPRSVPGRQPRTGGDRRHLAEVWPERVASRSEVRIELLTTYERLGQFSRDLARVVRGELQQAMIEGEVFGVVPDSASVRECHMKPNPNSSGCPVAVQTRAMARRATSSHHHLNRCQSISATAMRATPKATRCSGSR